MTYKCSCGASYSSKFQMARSINGYACGDCGHVFIRELYHQTSQQSANAILSSQTMRPGKKGIVGGGIYGATNPLDTNHKTHHHGPILKYQVENSVRVAYNLRGPEYVAYNSNQVKNIRPWGHYKNSFQ
eukprot:UN01478